jgi:hypothetical protein
MIEEFKGMRKKTTGAQSNNDSSIYLEAVWKPRKTRLGQQKASGRRNDTFGIHVKSENYVIIQLRLKRMLRRVMKVYTIFEFEIQIFIMWILCDFTFVVDPVVHLLQLQIYKMARRFTEWCTGEESEEIESESL